MIRLVFLLLALVGSGMEHAAGEQTTLGRFGAVAVYREKPEPLHVVLFVSGDGVEHRAFSGPLEPRCSSATRPERVGLRNPGPGANE